MDETRQRILARKRANSETLTRQCGRGDFGARVRSLRLLGAADVTDDARLYNCERALRTDTAVTVRAEAVAVLRAQLRTAPPEYAEAIVRLLCSAAMSDKAAPIRVAALRAVCDGAPLRTAAPLMAEKTLDACAECRNVAAQMLDAAALKAPHEVLAALRQNAAAEARIFAAALAGDSAQRAHARRLFATLYATLDTETDEQIAWLAELQCCAPRNFPHYAELFFGEP